jgi:Tol biopolymer transport system component
MLKRKTLICAVLGLLLSSLFTRPPLLAQSHSALTVWSTPVNLGPVINTPYIEQHPAISKDGLSLYFTSDRPGGFGGLDLWVSQRAGVDIPWGPPTNLGPNINTSGNENAPNLSIDGHRLYFGSTRPGGFGSSDIYVSHRQDKADDFGWEVPVNLGPNINTLAGENGPSIFEDEATGVTTLYFTSDRPGIGDFDIYASTQNEDDSFNLAVIVPELSSPYRDTRTAIRRDGLEIFISSERPGGVDLRDLWVSTRLTTSDPWGTPVNLGAPVNSTALEGAPALSFDGTTLYFFSNRAGGFGGLDLYVTTRGKRHTEEFDDSSEAENLKSGVGSSTQPR